MILFVILVPLVLGASAFAWPDNRTRPTLLLVGSVLHVLGIASLYGAFRVFSAQLDPALMGVSLHTGSELSGHAIVSGGVRSLTPFFNVYGTVTLVGGAIYSAWIFWRKRVLYHRFIGNILIAAGALLPAFGGGFSRMGIGGALYITELLGAVLMFIGFLRATTPTKGPEGWRGT